MSQNLISATLTAENSAAVQQNLKEVKDMLPFLLSLQSSDIQGIVKLGNAYLPFIEKVYQTVLNHPEILPGVFDKVEFIQDYKLLMALSPIVNQMNELAESLQKTFYAVGSDTLVAALDVYASVKQNQDKVPGLKASSDEMVAFFKKAKTKTATPA